MFALSENGIGIISLLAFCSEGKLSIGSFCQKQLFWSTPVHKCAANGLDQCYKRMCRVLFTILNSFDTFGSNRAARNCIQINFVRRQKLVQQTRLYAVDMGLRLWILRSFMWVRGYDAWYCFSIDCRKGDIATPYFNWRTVGEPWCSSWLMVTR